MDIFSHFKDIKLIELQAFGIDLSITKSVITLWVAALIVFVFFWLASRKTRLIPGKMQNLAEIVVEFVYTYLLDVFEKKEDQARWAPFILTLFSFILVINLLSMVPGFSPATTNINTTAAFALMAFFVYQMWGFMELGLARYFKTFVPKGIIWPAYILLVPIEIVSQMARPFSLAVRLFANMLAGHTMSLMFLSLIFVFKSVLIVPMAVGANVMISAFEVFVSMIQAYIFAYLTSIYLAFATKEEH